ncbi:Rhamnolipids biosynthesis 3-oxoacyl-[acyl-carrier-protein] reductase [Pseudocercospora fuligena]|uniref:Rhamnolipids biosynthesis 3-oxoacyl-[acyl-carrier-protein] reductase n=1 Tax=Pseudocercospora fuligena TaxID=685502 RepID=A0A8H6RRU4_9PEZI|nr:Rhamnolipids biosynthesis 3-oxoacyl-[acyl-carrier-protein] reductase [Pseudocercospora fuligena]
MASENAKSHNNEDFQLQSVFNVALITGGGSGIGLMATQALAVNGAKVYIVGRTEEKLQTVANTYSQGIEGQIIPITADISKKDSIAKLYDEIAQKEDHLDILINNAGISSTTFNTDATSAEELKKALFDNSDATFEDWEQVYRVNVGQLYFTTTAFLPLLQKATEKTKSWSGTVVNISSISGQVKLTQHHPQYNASKAAATRLTRQLANEIQSSGLKIRINSISPGVFPSEMTTSESGANQKSEIPKEKFEGKVPAQRPGNDRDMAGAVLFAVTNQYFNGQNLTVDGGYELSAGI